MSWPYISLNINHIKRLFQIKFLDLKSVFSFMYNHTLKFVWKISKVYIIDFIDHEAGVTLDPKELKADIPVLHM
jgi:hypothetical protein